MIQSIAHDKKKKYPVTNDQLFYISHVYFMKRFFFLDNIKRLGISFI